MLLSPCTLLQHPRSVRLYIEWLLGHIFGEKYVWQQVKEKNSDSKTVDKHVFMEEMYQEHEAVNILSSTISRRDMIF